MLSADGSEVTPLALADPFARRVAAGADAGAGRAAAQPHQRPAAAERGDADGTVSPSRCAASFAPAATTTRMRPNWLDGVPQQPARQGRWPIVFTKFAECVVGPFDDVRMPGSHVTTQIDYESELVVVIGKGGRDIARSQAMEHVFGYTVCNDVSARDVQVRHQQWDLGKSFDTFMPMGPCIVGVDELDGTDTRVRGWVNGELRQDGRTRDLIFDIPTLIETCSRASPCTPAT
jgi:2-keto-4-pentenoate hydratase/2-oxohepta-3-ene-1,7-dioic acid hydratase in catechol pathway